MSTDDILSQVTGASPRRILEDLARVGFALAKADRARPEVEVYLVSGQSIRGRIVSIADERNGPIAVLHISGPVRQPAVTFVRIDQIAGIHVADASLLVRAPTPDSPAPSKLELQRQLAAKADALQSRLGKPIKLELGGIDFDDDSRRAIGLLLPLLVDVLSAIASDQMGKEALASIDRIELLAGNGEVTKEQRGFSIRAPKLLTEQMTHATLRSAIEKHL